MRKLLQLLLLLWLLPAAATHAQQAASAAGETPWTGWPAANATPWQQRLDSIFQHVNRAPISSGLLLDYGYSFVDPANYQGAALLDSNYVDLGTWRLLYAGLQTSIFNANATLPPLPAANQQLAAQANPPGRVSLAVLLARYQQIRPDAGAAGLLLTYNGQLYDVSGRSQSPYQTRNLLAIAPTNDVLATRTVEFVPASTLLFTNAAPAIQQLQADFGDGQGYRTLNWDQPVTVSYAANGTKTLRYRLTCADGTVLQSHSLLEVNEPPAARYGTAIGDFTTSATSAMFMDVRPYAGQAATAKVTVALAQNNTTGKIRKPLIVVEGYDAGKFIAGASYDYWSFINKSSFGAINTDYIPTNPGDRSNFNDQLSEVGNYDLIFVDFDEGTDYIQRNAFLVERIIQWVNETKQPLNGVRQQNVVMGMSMGGLVARYALRDMEVRFTNGTSAVQHDTRLYISHEAPHQGANVPLSVQYMVRGVANIQLIGRINFNSGTLYNGLKVGDLNTPLRDFRDLLDQPATQQLLIVQASAQGQALHEAWLREYNQLGYPQQCRNVATSNGSECGTAQPYPPYSELLRLQGKGYLSKQLNQAIRMTTIRIGLSAGATVGAITGGPLGFGVVAAGFAIFSLGNYNGEVDFVLHALPSQQRQNIYHARFYLRKRILGINIRLQQYAEDKDSDASMLAWDTAPGGQYDVNVFAGGLLDNVRNNFPIPLNQYFVRPAFCFVPTTSALDIGRGDVAQSPQTLLASYSPTSPPALPYNVPFANFVTAGRGVEGHIQWTGLNSKWAFNEMEQTPQTTNCLAFCQATPTISGDNAICSSSTYSIAGLPPGASVQWRASPFGILSSSFGSGPTFTAMLVGSGAVTLQATISTDCGRLTINRTISTGVPAQIYIDGPDEINECDQAGEFYVRPYDPSLRYTVTSSGSVQAKPVRGGGALQLIPRRPGLGSVTVTAQNDCGSTTQDISVTVARCYYQYAVYPNPAQEDVTISAQPPEAARSAAAANSAAINPVPAFEATLYNGQGQAVRQGRSNGGELRLNLRGLRAGFYQLRTGQGSKWENHQLQVTE